MGDIVFSDFDPQPEDSERNLMAKQTSLAKESARQAVGWKDDGSESGIIRTLAYGGALVPRTLRAGTTTNDFARYETAGGASVVSTQRCLKNPDMSGNLLTVTCPAADFSYVKIKLAVYGRRFGVRWYFTTGQPTEPFSVVIDGRAYTVPFAIVEPIAQTNITAPEPWAQWVCPDPLSDDRHEVEIIFLGDRPTGSSRSWILYGVLLDSDAGYLPQVPCMPVFGPQLATTSYASFAPASPWDASNARIGKIFCFNQSASSADIFVSLTNADAGRFWSAAAIAPNATAICDLGPWGANLPLFYVKASALSSIQVSVQANIL